MASDSKKSNQAAGEGKRHCHRAHWLAVLGTMETMEIPEEWNPQEFGEDVAADIRRLFERPSEDGVFTLAQGAKAAARRLQVMLQASPCTCIDCQRHPRRSEEKNPHEGKVTL